MIVVCIAYLSPPSPGFGIDLLRQPCRHDQRGQLWQAPRSKLFLEPLKPMLNRSR